jgi:hypothetical protein
MNPQEQDHVPSFELPPAHASEQVPAPVAHEQQGITNEAQAAVALEHGTPQAAPSQQQVQAAQQVPMPQAPPTAQPNPSAGAPANAATPQIADDTDLIEKEWVIKAKEIVSKTARDPHLQNREINRFKAEYLKKRYNKDLKLSEDT